MAIPQEIPYSRKAKVTKPQTPNYHRSTNKQRTKQRRSFLEIIGAIN